jgi:hypothetical protein
MILFSTMRLSMSTAYFIGSIESTTRIMNRQSTTISDISSQMFYTPNSVIRLKCHLGSRFTRATNLPLMHMLTGKFRSIESFQRMAGGSADYNDGEGLAFPSTYLAANGAPRGFCNWLLPGKIMAGRYPHSTPWGSKTGSPTPDEARTLHEQLAAAGVNAFVCLQEEVPPQDADPSLGAAGWPDSGLIPHAKAAHGFRRYLPDAVAAAAAAGRPPPRFLRLPITDFGVPDEAALLPPLAALAADVRSGAAVPYLHCWGGRGRAGTVGACLLLALRLGPEAAAAAAAAPAAALATADALAAPDAAEAEAAAEAALVTVQAGYDTRVGEDGGGSLSPETEGQRAFVRRIARVLIAARRAASAAAA